MSNPSEKSSIPAAALGTGNPDPTVLYDKACDLSFALGLAENPNALEEIQTALRASWQRGWVARDNRERRRQQRR